MSASRAQLQLVCAVDQRSKSDELTSLVWLSPLRPC